MGNQPTKFTTFRDLHLAKNEEAERPKQIQPVKTQVSAQHDNDSKDSANQSLSDRKNPDSVPQSLSDDQTLSAQQSLSVTLALQNPTPGSTIIPNSLLDGVFPNLRVQDQVVYLRLFRLSHGFHTETCKVGYDKISKACNLSRREVIRSIERLEMVGLVKRLGCDFRTPTKAIRANLYQVNLPIAESVSQTLSASQSPSVSQSLSASQSPNNHDHDDFKIKDHHQKAVMRIYQTLTGKDWTKGDTAHYRKVSTLPLEQLELLMRTIHTRANEPIGSFAYFSSSIQKEIALPGQDSRAAIKKKMEKIVSEIKQLHVGDNNFNLSDLAHETKMQCMHIGLTWNDDVFNEITN